MAFHALYPRLSDQTLAGLASVAFQGAVRSISPARWNTTGGALWEAGPLGPRPLPFHLITFRLDRPIRGGSSRTIAVTVFGASPAGSVGGSLFGRPDHDLRVGDRVLVLAVPGAPAAWADDVPIPPGYTVTAHDSPAAGVEHFVLSRTNPAMVVNVARIAERFGGGGHVCASGCSLAGPLQSASDKMAAS